MVLCRPMKTAYLAQFFPASGFTYWVYSPLKRYNIYADRRRNIMTSSFFKIVSHGTKIGLHNYKLKTINKFMFRKKKLTLYAVPSVLSSVLQTSLLLWRLKYGTQKEWRQLKVTMKGS